MKTSKVNQTVETLKTVAFFVVIAAFAVFTIAQFVSYSGLGRI